MSNNKDFKVKNGLDVGGTINTDGVLTTTTTKHTFNTPYGYIRLGPSNSSWGHIETDRSRFYFNKGIDVNGTVKKYNGAEYWHPDNDGSGSGLDADTVDGIQGANFLRSDTSDTMSGNLTVTGQLIGGLGAATTSGTTDWNHSTNARSGNGYTLLLGSHTNGPSGAGYYHPVTYEYNSKNGNGNMSQFAIPYSGTDMFLRTRYSGSWTGWSKFWNSGNDGSGSGLDADLLDGNHASAFATSGHTHSYLPLAGGTLTGALTGTTGTFRADTDALTIQSVTNQNAAEIAFSSQGPTSYAQKGRVSFQHGDTLAYGSGAAFILDSNESTTTILADGKLMYSEGIYSKPSSGTGAGTRKDSNWNTAYTHSQATHAPTNAEANRTISDSVASTSSSTSASSQAVKTAYDMGNHSHPYAATSHSHSGYASSTHTHSYLPLAGGDLTGNVSWANGKSFYINGSGGGRVPYPAGATYFTTTGGHTGAIKIKLPTASKGNSDMISFEVSIFDYNNNESLKLLINAYQYSTVNWTNHTVVILTGSSSKDYTVRFGSDATSHCVWIAETSSTWSHPQVSVSNFTCGYSANAANYVDGWAVTFVTSFDTVQDTVTTNLPVPQIVNDSINSQHYAAGSIDNEHIADNAINSEHYADNSIDALHLNVSGNGTTSQYLRSGGDGSMSWGTPPSGGPSLGSNSIIRTNASTISENITIPSGTNGMTAGPITIANGYTITVNGDWSVI
jgi:hypothetical protein